MILVDKYGAQEPINVMIDEFIADAGKFDYDRIVAVGGGAVMDMSKVVAVAGGISIDDVIDHLPDFRRSVRLVLVPTTCGTGSEVAEIAAINRTRLGCKAGIAGPEMFADDAVLVPELLHGLPDHVFATSSLDVLVHSVESTLSPNSTPYTRMFGYEAMKMIISGYNRCRSWSRRFAGAPRQAQRTDARLPDRLRLCGYQLRYRRVRCRACAELSARRKISCAPRESNYAMFTGVLRNYMEIKPEGEILKMNQFIADILGCDVAYVYDELETFINKLLPKKALHEYGVTEQDLPEFVDRVIKTQERLMKNCFVPLDYDRVLKIFKELY